MSLADKDPIRDAADRIIRANLKHPDNLRGVLQRVVSDLADRFLCEQLEEVTRDFPLDDWREREADVLLRIPFQLDTETLFAFVIVHIEHQSDTDLLMPLRMLLFTVLYWERQWRDWASLSPPRPALRLHPVLPIVFYTGNVAWGSNRRIEELLGPPEAFHVYAPNWGPLFWNLADESEEELLGSDNAMLHTLSVLRVESTDAKEFESVFRKATKRIEKISPKDKPRWYDLMRVLFTWIAWRRPREEYPQLFEIVKSSLPSTHRQKEFEEMIAKTLGPSLTDWAKMEGREEGRREGSLRAYQDSIIKILTNRFQEIPDSVRERITASTDVEELQQAVPKAATCDTIEDFQL